MTALVVALAAGIPCAAALLGFRWWLDARPKPVPRDELELRLKALEEWKQRVEFSQVRR